MPELSQISVEALALAIQAAYPPGSEQLNANEDGELRERLIATRAPLMRAIPMIINNLGPSTLIVIGIRIGLALAGDPQLAERGATSAS